ncbi:hypothetical protein BJF79_08655 [Actinomadura sp. CNU-125]|uniref:hypothetical protein n=1 Tax=Actinomadura sp. CNU-125 TaxID=1904961 RepID=UPI000967E478|nr:hypothetical protein [Actinomadura sp. CNU-125]OLT31854.1 hypothetical protein BJF79_08655 [Actinomadura sp. CNU-125]
MNVLTRACQCKKRTTMQHACRSLLAFGANRSQSCNRGRLRTLLQHRTADRPRLLPLRHRDDELLARTFGHPQGAGFTGPGANGLLRAILTEALTSKVGVSWVIATRRDLHRLGADVFDDQTLDRFSSRLQVTDTLEDTIERLEFEADVVRALDVNDAAAPTHRPCSGSRRRVRTPMSSTSPSVTGPPPTSSRSSAARGRTGPPTSSKRTAPGRSLSGP